MSEFNNITTVKEVSEDVANRLLKLGWKILILKEVPVFNTEGGLFHSKSYQTGRKTVYVMGCPSNIVQMIKEDYDNIYNYLSRVEKLKKEQIK